MSANNSALKGVTGSKYKNIGVVENKPDESQRRRVRIILLLLLYVRFSYRHLPSSNLFHLLLKNPPRAAASPFLTLFQSSSDTKFGGLMSQKRNSTDVAAAARKASWAEQSKPPGFFGSMWHSFTKGNGPDSK
ncbi:MAG: hypothetical protein Q9178_006419 [Gyalolechia marmorata]